jgi:hypothetical protein
MGRMPLAMFLWPGLPQLWKRGSWTALVYAVAFAGVVNAIVLFSLVWTELLPPVFRNTMWLMVAVVWVGSAVFSWLGGRDETTRPDGRTGRQPDAFPEALEHYLRGNWFEAECVLEGLLRRNPRDVEAGLLMVSLLRHTGRFDEAAGRLDRLERFEESGKWELEMGRERRWLEEARQSQATQPVGPANGE